MCEADFWSHTLTCFGLLGQCKAIARARGICLSGSGCQNMAYEAIAHEHSEGCQAHGIDIDHNRFLQLQMCVCEVAIRLPNLPAMISACKAA